MRASSNDVTHPEEDLVLRETVERLAAQGNLLLPHSVAVSVKIAHKNSFPADEEILYLRPGPEAAWLGFAVNRLRDLSAADGAEQMDRRTELWRCLATPAAISAIPASAPLHAVVPSRVVLQAQPIALLVLCNIPSGTELLQRLYAQKAKVLPYARPGLDLARLAQKASANRSVPVPDGYILLKNGVLSFGETAEEAYARMLELIAVAHDHLGRKRPPVPLRRAPLEPLSENLRSELPLVRRQISQLTGQPMLLSCAGGQAVRNFLARGDLLALTSRGPAAPQHLAWTKRTPLLGRNLEAFAQAYQAYFARYASAGQQMRDPAPRVLLDAEFGLLAVAPDAAQLRLVESIAQQTLRMIEEAEDLERWTPLTEREAFEAEYAQEYADEMMTPPGSDFRGEVVLVADLPSPLGAACEQHFLKRGAAVVSVNPARRETHQTAFATQAELSDEEEVRSLLTEIVQKFGGLDVVVFDEGHFSTQAAAADLQLQGWQETMRHLLDARLMLLRECHSILRHSPKGGRIILTRNDAGSSSLKAAERAGRSALAALVQTAALEWRAERIRVNLVERRQDWADPWETLEAGSRTPEPGRPAGWAHQLRAEQTTPAGRFALLIAMLASAEFQLSGQILQVG